MDISVEEKINLATLQRYDPFITDICATSKQTTLYTFDSSANEWRRTEVEGASFVYKRSAPPIYGYMILNRLGKDNFVEPIKPTLEFQRHNHFLLYRNPEAIYGIWFYDAEECDQVSYLLNKLVNQARQGKNNIGQKTANVTVMSTKSSKQTREIEESAKPVTDILRMLSRAQSDYDKKCEPPAVTSQPNEEAVIKPQAVKPESKDGRRSIDIEELFRNASHNYKKKTIITKSSTPTGHAFHRPPPLNEVQTVADLEKEHSPTTQAELITPASFSNPHATVAGVLTLNGSHTNHIQPQQIHTPSKTPALDHSLAHTLMSPLTHTLMSPMAFAVPHNTKPVIPVAVNPPQLVSEPSFDFNFSSSSMSAEVGSTAAADLSPTAALTKDQLLQAFEHLLKTDENFLKSLHKAYVDSLNASLR